MKKCIFSGGVIEKISDFIMLITFDNKRAITVADMKEITKIRHELFGDKKYCTLIDCRKDFINFSSDATTYIANHPRINEQRIAEAVFVKNVGQSLGGQLYIKLFKPKSETKLFYKEENAIAWLNKQYAAFNKEA
ncbi:MAG: hypothetical protein GQ574_03655 [Crocinitomix sp.]|nr:hypothetical protein [Crocinitomix sp.]